MPIGTWALSSCPINDAGQIQKEKQALQHAPWTLLQTFGQGYCFCCQWKLCVTSPFGILSWWNQSKIKEHGESIFISSSTRSSILRTDYSSISSSIFLFLLNLDLFALPCFETAIFSLDVSSSPVIIKMKYLFWSCDQFLCEVCFFLVWTFEEKVGLVVSWSWFPFSWSSLLS